MEGRGASKFNKAVIKVKGLAVLGQKKNLFPFLNWKEQDREGRFRAHVVLAPI